MTFGVQTLDTNELRRQKRTNPALDKLRDLTECALSKGLRVSYDLMAFLNDDIGEDMQRLSSDLDYVLAELRPTAVDIYPTSPNLEGAREVVVEKIRRLQTSSFVR